MKDDWKCMKESNKNAFLNIYQQNYKFLFSYGFSLTGDKEFTKDCIQEIFIELWNTRSTVNNDVQNVRSYLATWLRRKISRIQARIIKEKLSWEYSTGITENEMSYEELLIAMQDTKEKKEKLSKALNHLTKKQLEIIRLKFFENLSYDEIAARTALSTRTIYNTIHLSIRRLRADIVMPEHV